MGLLNIMLIIGNYNPDCASDRWGLSSSGLCWGYYLVLRCGHHDREIARC